MITYRQNQTIFEYLDEDTCPEAHSLGVLPLLVAEPDHLAKLILGLTNLVGNPVDLSLESSSGDIGTHGRM